MGMRRPGENVRHGAASSHWRDPVQPARRLSRVDRTFRGARTGARSQRKPTDSSRNTRWRAADRRRRRRSGFLWRERATRASTMPSQGATSSKSISHAARWNGSSDSRDLPRRAGAERRRWRHAGAGHSHRGHDRSVTQHHRAQERVAHDIEVAADSRLRSALGGAVDASCACRVNSRHHQSVGKLGERLVASAKAPDGVIEGIEAPDARLLRRRPVAPRELLAHRGIQAAL